MQRHPLPRKRQRQLVSTLDRPPRMQRRIQYRGVDPETGHAHFFGGGHLRIDFSASSPHAPHTAKRAPVAIPALGQPLVHASRIHRRGTHGRPHRQIRPCTDAPARNTHSACNNHESSRCQPNTPMLCGSPIHQRRPPPPAPEPHRSATMPAAPATSTPPPPGNRPRRLPAKPTPQSRPRETAPPR